MPGIVAIITKAPKASTIPRLVRAAESLRHEDFYSLGTWTDEQLGAYVGWVAHAGSFSDGMPLKNEDRKVTLVFSGEEFSDSGVGSGSSYLIRSYEMDKSFPKGLNGRFHGVVFDENRAAVVVFNDRYGMHRLYHYQSQDAHYFATEAKAILTICPELRELDPQGVGELVACGAVLENRTMFAGLKLLPPASRVIFRNGSLERSDTYFSPREWEEQEQLSPDSFYEQLRESFARIVPRYFAGNQPIGMSLTGGLDSRMLMAWCNAAPGMLPCYTFGGTLRDCQDVIVGRRVAQICEQPHQVIRAGEEFLSRFAHYAERTVYLSDGYADAGHAPNLYVHERARNVAPVRMTGLFGGEVLRDVHAFKPELPNAKLFQPDFFSCVQRAEESYRETRKGDQLSFITFKQGAWYHHASLALEQTQVSVRSPFLDNELVRVIYRAPRSLLSTADVSLRLIRDGNQALLSVATDRGLRANGGIRGAIARVWKEFLFKAEYGYDLGMPQWVCRIDHALSPLRLDRLFLGRHKIFHFRKWYREQLAEYLRETLLSPRSLSRPYIQPEGLKSVVEGHLTGLQNYTREIHKALTLELIHRVFIDRHEEPQHSNLRSESLAAPQSN